MHANWLEFYKTFSTFTAFNHNPNDIALGWYTKLNAVTNPSVIQAVQGCDSSVDIATRYGPDGPRIESQWGGGEIFRTRTERPWGPPGLLYDEYRVFSGVKSAGAWR